MIKTLNVICQYISIGRFLVVILSFPFFVACSSDEPTKEEVVRSLEIEIDNQNLKIINSSVSSNENCDELFVNCRYYTKEDIGFRIEFWLRKNGVLRSVRLYDYRNKALVYETASFNPKGLMTISNFKYDEATHYLYFDFDGALIQETYSSELSVEKPRKYIKGSVDIENLITTRCESYSSNLSFVSNNLIFSTSVNFNSYVSNSKTNIYQFSFYSDNGYRAVFKSSKDLWDLDKGIYVFDQNTVESRIDFQKYIGIFRFTQMGLSDLVDWKKYQTSGTYTIIEHRIVNGQKVTSGEFNLQVYNNGLLLHNVNNGKFEVTGF